VFAIFNYVNLSVSLTTERSKEMATRRLLGLSRLQVFGKLIGESILFTAIAFVVGYVIALALQDKAMEMANCPLDLLKDTGFGTIAAFVTGIFLVGSLAGFVPSTILSGYQPIDIVRGTFRRRVRQRWSHAIPLSYWLAPMVSSISGLTVRMELMPLLLSLVIVLAVNLLTAAVQSWRAATENPVNNIKTE
jgi:ABC-type antimicrobial peptide transport system permease subunit